MNSLDKDLELFAADEPGTEIVDAAQVRLDARIRAQVAARPKRRIRADGWLAATVSALAIAVTLVWLPLASTPALAFSAVQEHFRDFRTLRFEMRQRVQGQEGLVTRVATTRDGKLRTDVGTDVSVIVNTHERRVLTLIHPEHMAMESPIGGTVGDDDSMAWLEDVRTFKGAARRLPDPRTIDGRLGYGWQLRVQNMDIVLWATEDGVPLEMNMTGANEARFDFHFEFDVPLPDELFSTAIPTGYSRAEAED